jgi:hypothetical protein
MKRFQILGLAIMVGFALSAVGAASASAFTEFIGKPVGAEIKDHNLNTHKFKTSVGTVECKKTTSKGKVEAEHSATNKESVKYEECKLTSPFEGAATVSEAVYLFHANGEVDVENTITVSTSLCTITVAPQKGLKEVKYTNNGGKIKINAAVKGIKYTTSGFCGTKSEANGEYTGESEAEAVGGTLEVK